MYKITTKIKNKTITWIFGYEWDFNTYTKYILPYTGILYEIVETDIPDFIVSVYQDFYEELPCRQLIFKVSGEYGERLHKLPNCYQFVNNPKPEDDLTWTKYSWGFNQWSGPHLMPKTKKISVVDSGKWEHRKEKIKELGKIVGGIDIYGNLNNMLLTGYHQPGINEKYKGIEEYAFYFSMEHSIANDYLTEKIVDAIMCEAVPIYIGAPNIDQYMIKGSYINYEDVEKIDWSNWQSEYQKYRQSIIKQKEIFLTKLNVFSYFDYLTDNLYLLSKIRPITLENIKN